MNTNNEEEIPSRPDKEDGLSEKELDYLIIYEEAMKTITPLLDEACSKIEEAMSVADKKGIAFHTRVCILENTYCSPDFINKKLSTFNEETDLEGITAVYEPTHIGWEHSQIC